MCVNLKYEFCCTYRLRSLASEQRALKESDPDLKKGWQDLAIEWHLLANLAAQAADDKPQVDIV
jgi:hypothetical protein